MKINFKTFLLTAFTIAVSYACSENSITNEIPANTVSSNTGSNVVDSTGNSTKTTNSDVIFEDNFDQTSSVPDQTKWKLPSGYINGPHAPHSYDQAYVQNGCLVLNATKNAEGKYKTGSIWTSRIFDFTYGKVECRAKIKPITGGHASIWLLSYPLDEINWEVDGEIDIMEQYNKDQEVHSTVHSYYTLTLGHTKDPINHVPTSCNIEQFNTYAVEWTPEKVEFSVNGKVTFSYPNLHLANEATLRQWSFDKPFYIIMDYNMDDSSVIDSELPGVMQIDWIKITKVQ